MSTTSLSWLLQVIKKRLLGTDVAGAQASTACAQIQDIYCCQTMQQHQPFPWVSKKYEWLLLGPLSGPHLSPHSASCHLTTGQDKALPESTILVAIPANMQPGEAISASMLRQRSFQGTPMDAEAPVTGFPMRMDSHALSAPIPGQLVFLPDLPNTVQLWHNQRLIMVVWLISSIISLVLFAPLFMASGLFLAAEIAAVMGVIAAIVQLCEREIASSNSKCRLGCLPSGGVLCGVAQTAVLLSQPAGTQNNS